MVVVVAAVVVVVNDEQQPLQLLLQDVAKEMLVGNTCLGEDALEMFEPLFGDAFETVEVPCGVAFAFVVDHSC